MHQSTISLLFGLLLAGSAVAAEPVQDSAASYAGRYVLADGRILTVSAQDDKLTAVIAANAAAARSMRVGAEREVVLHRNGPGRFVATSSPLQIDFGKDARGDIVQVSTSDVVAPRTPMAQR